VADIDDGSLTGPWPLRGNRVLLRPTTMEDVPALAEILAEGSVARWWPSYDAPRVERDLVDDVQGERHYVIERDGRIVGLIQSYEEEEPEFHHAGIDLFLATDVQGKGLGPDAIATLARYLIDVQAHHRLTIDPAADNHAAIAAYRKVGFRPVGVMRAYQRMGDGTWVDALLMEMLADELVR
jgi:aminoglycoside 6'-N-acetyltransferase